MATGLVAPMGVAACGSDSGPSAATDAASDVAVAETDATDATGTQTAPAEDTVASDVAAGTACVNDTDKATYAAAGDKWSCKMQACGIQCIVEMDPAKQLACVTKCMSEGEAPVFTAACAACQAVYGGCMQDKQCVGPCLADKNSTDCKTCSAQCHAVFAACGGLMPDGTAWP